MWEQRVRRRVAAESFDGQGGMLLAAFHVHHLVQAPLESRAGEGLAERRLPANETLFRASASLIRTRTSVSAANRQGEQSVRVLSLHGREGPNQIRRQGSLLEPWTPAIERSAGVKRVVFVRASRTTLVIISRRVPSPGPPLLRSGRARFAHASCPPTPL